MLFLHDHEGPILVNPAHILWVRPYAGTLYNRYGWCSEIALAITVTGGAQEQCLQYVYVKETFEQITTILCGLSFQRKKKQ